MAQSLRDLEVICEWFGLMFDRFSNSYLFLDMKPSTRWSEVALPWSNVPGALRNG